MTSAIHDDRQDTASHSGVHALQRRKFRRYRFFEDIKEGESAYTKGVRLSNLRKTEFLEERKALISVRLPRIYTDKVLE